jgi:hypothetical protein
MAKFIQYPSEFSNTNWTSVAYSTGGGNVYVAVGNAGAYRVARSTDNGVTWTYPLGLTDAAQTRTWTAVTWNPGASLFIAVASGTGTGRIMTSPNGTTWTVQTYSVDQQAVSFNAAASSATRTVIVGGGGVAADQTITTTNGSTFTSVPAHAVRNWTGVSWNNVSASANWVAVANDGAAAGAVMTNTEAGLAGSTAWTTRTAATPPTATPWVSVAGQQAASGVMVAVASSGTQATRIMTSSDDGASWTSRDPGVDVNFSYVFATGEGYYALGTTGTQTQRILTSTNGTTWTVGTALPTTPNKWASCISNGYGAPSVLVFVSNSGGSSRILRMTNSTLTLSAPIEINDSYTRVRTNLPTYINLDKVMLLNPIDEGQINLPQAAGSSAQDFVTLSFGADPTGVTHEIIVQDIINASSPKSSTSLFGYIASELPQNRTVIVTRS